MSIIDNAIRDLFFRIPPEILTRIFAPGRDIFNYDRPAVEQAIRTQVIESKVRVDCDLIGAKEVSIPLIGLKFTRYTQFSVVIRVPKELTGGRSITSVLAVTYGYAGIQGFPATTDFLTQYGNSNYSLANDKSIGILNAQSPIPDIQNAYAYLVGENTVAIEGYSPLLMYGFLRCMVSHDEMFSTLPATAQSHFSQLVFLATKMYIYTNYIIKMDAGELYGGRELGRFASIIEGYESAAEEYDEFLRTTWRKVSYLADPERKYRLIRQMTGSMGT